MNTAFECPLFIYVVSFRLAIISQQFIMIDIYKSNRSNPSRYMLTVSLEGFWLCSLGKLQRIAVGHLVQGMTARMLS